MILFFRSESNLVYGVGAVTSFSAQDIEKLVWLFGSAKPLIDKSLNGKFIGPRKEMITPWSTNAVEITQTMGIAGIERIEEFFESSSPAPTYDRMLQHLYETLDQDIFTIHHTPEPILEIADIKNYPLKKGM